MDSEDNVRKFHKKRAGSGIRDSGYRKIYPGSRIQGAKKHQISDPGSATLGVHM
jgi:hypothetical protein